MVKITKDMVLGALPEMSMAALRDIQAAVGVLLGKKVVEIKDYDGMKLICEDESWLMFRDSGTEPIMRTYAEGKSLTQAKKLLELGKEIILKGCHWQK